MWLGSFSLHQTSPLQQPTALAPSLVIMLMTGYGSGGAVLQVALSYRWRSPAGGVFHQVYRSGGADHQVYCSGVPFKSSVQLLLFMCYFPAVLSRGTAQLSLSSCFCPGTLLSCYCPTVLSSCSARLPHESVLSGCSARLVYEGVLSGCSARLFYEGAM